MHILKKKIFMIVGFIVGVLTLGVFYTLNLNHNQSGVATGVRGDTPVEVIAASYVKNYNEDTILVGEAQNIFVAKVIKKTGDLDRNKTPHSQFEAEVVYNIKGDLRGVVTVDQTGGLKNGTLYVFAGDELLVPGSTYVFATRHIEELSPLYFIGSHPAFKGVISEESNLSNEQLVELAKRNSRILELLVAYPNEVLGEGDVQQGYARNSFQSLSDEQKQAVYDEIEALSKN